MSDSFLEPKYKFPVIRGMDHVPVLDGHTSGETNLVLIYFFCMAISETGRTRPITIYHMVRYANPIWVMKTIPNTGIPVPMTMSLSFIFAIAIILLLNPIMRNFIVLGLTFLISMFLVYVFIVPVYLIGV
jgi:hypothetical protein